MDNAFSRLLKVITLERKQGYRNKAVIGGLDKFASRWEVDARAEATDQAAINEIVALLIGYPSVTEQSARERIIEQIVRRLRDIGVSGISSREPQSPEPQTSEPGATLAPAPARPATPPAPAPTRPGAAGEQTSARDRAAPSQPGHRRRAETAADTSPVAAQTGDVVRTSTPGVPPTSPEGIGMPAEPTETGKESTRAVPATPITRAEPPRHLSERRAPREASRRASSPSAPARTETRRADEPADADRAPAAQAASVLPDETLLVSDENAPEASAWETNAWEASDSEPGASELELSGETEAEPTARPARPGRISTRRPGANAEETGPSRSLDAPVTRIRSIGPSFAEKLSKLDVHTVRDLFYLLPYRYDDFSKLRTIDKLSLHDEVTVIGTVWNVDSRPLSDDRRMTIAVVGDGTGQMQMTWFSPYVERQLHVGRAFVFSGRIDSHRGRLGMSNPTFESLEREQVSTGRLVPVYPLTHGITAHWLRNVMDSALKDWADSIVDFLPANVRVELNLLPLAAALAQIHFPDNMERLAAARRRLSFDEFFVLQLGVLGTRQRFRGLSARPLTGDDTIMTPFLSTLPFSMTDAQCRVLGEISRDLANSQPMSRLLQGDVGSGKTAVAAAALWIAVANGTQGAIMAPTEILAEQHARSFAAMFAGLTRPGTDQPIQIALLTGRKRKAERADVLAALESGKIDIAVGTHALIQEEVTFHNLSMAVVDEQHRFGVEQRAALRQKGIQPHMLVMSATPIPRSLALTLYGDLDVSVIDQMPAGRTPIKTKWMTSTQRERAYDFVRRQVASGRQAFIIYPLVESSESSEAKAAVDEHARLQNTVFPDLRLGLLHGRLRGEEKDAVMQAFSAHELDILVATSVVEVGIDVPNATVIMIEGAERFGLAQLHQFRGRVGRGEFSSYCILVSDAGEGDSARRLQALETSTDGFALAQTDLEMRGPGDFLGTRQSGLPPLHLAQLSDLRTLEEARTAAQRLFATDPELRKPEYSALAARVSAFWAAAEAGDPS